MTSFRTPKKSLGNLDAEAAGAVIEAASDIALVLDAAGIVRDVSFQSEDLKQEFPDSDNWPGRPWVEIVSLDSRAKVEALLREAPAVRTAPREEAGGRNGASAGSRPRHVNHPSNGDADVPVLYTAIRLGPGRVVACGRDLRVISTLQRRLLDAQQSMERDYAKLRQVETRYRLLFQMSPEAVLIVDALTQRVVESNPAAARLLEAGTARLTDRIFPELFTSESQLSVQAMLAGVRAAGKGQELRAKLAHDPAEVGVSAMLFRQENASFYLIRVAAAGDEVVAAPQGTVMLLKLVEKAPDGFVVIAPDGRIQAANAAFLDMAELATDSQASGERLDRWLGRPGVDLDVLIANLRQRGSIRLFSTTMRGEFGASLDVELSAATVGEDEALGYGFAIRNVGRRLAGERRAFTDLPRSAESLTELIGRVSLKDLVRESTDMIERLCIEAALEVTGDNRASAAEMLGLSRQSLYVKLRRYGLGDLDDVGRE